MSAAWEQELDAELTRLQQQGLLRQLQPVAGTDGRRLEIEGHSFVNFASNDYLALARHPALQEAAVRALRQWGAGSTASRLVCGSLRIHHDLEARLAAFKGTAAALSFASGYATALGTIPALVERGDFVLLDRLAHACLVDGARLSGATLRVFRHNDLDDLDRLLRWADAQRSAAASRPRPPRVLVITESVFSMDGDRAPLRAIVELKDRYGAWLMVDEAHATGLFGPRGEGLIAAEGLTDRVEVQMGTLGKALGSAGGFIAGSARLIHWLVQRARSFMFSTAPPPAQAAAALAALELLQTPEGAQRRDRLWHNVHTAAAPLPDGSSPWPGLVVPPPSAILPRILGSNDAALRCAQAARQAGLFIPAIRYPAVSRGTARLRITITAAHQPEDLARLRSFLATLTTASRDNDAA
ncbi:MAG: 8-amino-7-oxononanoate synthase [Limisphaera sp.]|nr:8-amino-7-oxononanoate synthase [Limisphaera sp.]